MIENINLNTAEVTAELHGYLYNGVLKSHGVYDTGNKLAHTVVTNNEITLADGLLCNQGRFMRIVGSESVTIDNGTSGVVRTDLIVAHFETDGINETHDIRVIKGAADGSVPAHAESDIYNGGTANDLVLYKVTLNGLNIESVDAQFNLMEPVEKVESNSLNKVVRGDSSKTTFVKFAEVTITQAYANGPFKIDFAQRGSYAGEVAVEFKSTETTDPDINILASRAWYGCTAPQVYACKLGTGRWGLYIKKPASYDSITILSYTASQYVKDHISIEWMDEETAELPAGNIAAEREPYIKVMTQAEYDALTTKNTNTLYFLTE